MINVSADDERYNFNRFNDLKVLKDDPNKNNFLKGPLTKLDSHHTTKDLKLGNLVLPDISFTTVAPPFFLIGIWLVFTALFNFVPKTIFGTMPLLYGHAILNGGDLGAKFLGTIWHWVITHGLIGRVGLLFFFVVIILITTIATFISILVHASVSHVLFNGLLLLLLCACAYVLGYKPIATVNRWLAFGYISTLTSYGIAEMLGAFLRLYKQTNLHPELHTWYTLLWNANLPFVGASVGLLSLLGCLLSVTIKQIIQGELHWLVLILLSILALIYIVMYAGKMMATPVDISSAMVCVGAFMHLFGLFFGLGRGLLRGFR